MREDEYNLLIHDPSDFWMRTYIPRVFGAFEPWKYLNPFTSIIEIPAAWFMPYTRPDLQATAQQLIDIGKELTVWSKMTGAFDQWAQESGYPLRRMVLCKAPFDTIGDTLRGTKGIIRDMFRRPGQLLEAIDVVTDFTIRQTVAAANATRAHSASFPLHKGADGFMSPKQFEKFYWPGLKATILALIEAGYTPYVFWEGDYTSRLPYLLEIPSGKIICRLDRTDIYKAKKVLGGHHGIAGGMLPSLLQTGSVQQVKVECIKLIESIGNDGGFIMGSSCPLDEEKAENVKAMVEATRQYGI
jgi:uroporphyrinogen-III decarboxylase